MDPILDFLNQPIILTLVTLIVGSYLLDLVAERRSRRDRSKDQAIEFINDVADHTNAFVVAVFDKLRPNNLVVDDHLRNAIRDLFSGRMSIEIRSKAYLKSEDFHTQYFIMMGEFADVMETLVWVDQGVPDEEIIPRIQAKCYGLVQSWPLAGERTAPDSEELVQHLILWMEMINHRVTDLLTRHLKKVMGD